MKSTEKSMHLKTPSQVIPVIQFAYLILGYVYQHCIMLFKVCFRKIGFIMLVGRGALLCYYN